MPAKKTLKIISVTGAHSSVGKTTLCSILLNGLEGFGAIKFTKTDARCKTQDAKLKKDKNSEFIEDIEILKQKGKDTAVMLKSGAEKVIWIKSSYARLEPLLSVALSRMSALKGVIVEGNSPVDFINPHLIIFIIDPDGEIKPSAVKVSKKADIIIINSRDQFKKRLPFLSTIETKRKKVLWIDLINKRGKINELLNYVKEAINKSKN